MNVKMCKVTWHDDGGDHESKSMSRAEANETAARLRIHQATNVQVVPAYPPKPAAGYDEHWRIVP